LIGIGINEYCQQPNIALERGKMYVFWEHNTAFIWAKKNIGF